MKWGECACGRLPSFLCVRGYAGQPADAVVRDRTLALPRRSRFALEPDRSTLRQGCRREGCDLLRIHRAGHDPVQLWTFHIRLIEVEPAFMEFRHDPAVCPIYHSSKPRTDAHIGDQAHERCGHERAAAVAAVRLHDGTSGRWEALHKADPRRSATRTAENPMSTFCGLPAQKDSAPRMSRARHLTCVVDAEV